MNSTKHHLAKNKELKYLKPYDGMKIYLPNYRIECIKSSDGSFSKSKVLSYITDDYLDFFFDGMPVFIFKFLNKF